jgi:hypothetical protein
MDKALRDLVKIRIPEEAKFEEDPLQGKSSELEIIKLLQAILSVLEEINAK